MFSMCLYFWSALAVSTRGVLLAGALEQKQLKKGAFMTLIFRRLIDATVDLVNGGNFV